MSADNGVYVARFLNGESFVHRVAHCFSIENCDSNEALSEDMANVYRVLYFNDSPEYKTETEAIKAAREIANNMEFLEYGIQSVYFDCSWPRMTIEQAQSVYDKHWN